MTSAPADEFYERQGAYWDAFRSEEWFRDLHEVIRRVSSFGGGTTLEPVCGTGWWTIHLVQRGSVVAADQCRDSLAETRERLAAINQSARLLCASAAELPVASQSFDCAFCGFWLARATGDTAARFMAQLTRLLKPGATVMVVDEVSTTERLWPQASGSAQHGFTVATINRLLSPIGDVETSPIGRTFVLALARVPSTK